jgi:hypothetical protein
MKDEGLIRQIMERNDIIEFEVRKENRDALLARILEIVRSIGPNSRPEQD